jgi:glycosyltransferase involved in cell wall biosynthesis
MHYRRINRAWPLFSFLPFFLAEVEVLAASLAIGAQIRFVGAVEGEAKRTLLGGSDFFVLTSHQEGDSVAIKEALAAGLPLLISNRCHFPEVQTAGAGVVTDDTADAVAVRLRDILREETWAGRRAAARQLASEFGNAALAARLARIYKAIASGSEVPVA